MAYMNFIGCYLFAKNTPKPDSVYGTYVNFHVVLPNKLFFYHLNISEI